MVKQERLPPGPPPLPPQSTPPQQLLSPAKEAIQLPLEQVEMQGNQLKEKKGGIFWLWWMRCQIAGKEQRRKQDELILWDNKDENEQQWWNELVWRGH